jgi:hypothetical protein
MSAQAREIKQVFEVLQSIYQNTIDDSFPRVEQPSHILSELRPHQLALIHSMKYHESSLRLGLRTTNGLLFSTFGILGDFPGSGKTLTILGEISHLKNHPLEPRQNEFHLNPNSTPNLFSLTIIPIQVQRRFKNLIVVPNYLFKQWADSITNQTTLTYFLIKTIRDVDREDLYTELEESDVVLIQNTLLHQFLARMEVEDIQYMFDRVFFDEADNIKIAQTCSDVKANMTWLVSSSFENLLFHGLSSNSSMLRSIFPQQQLERVHVEVQEFIQSELQLHPSQFSFYTASFPYFRQFIGTSHPQKGFLVIRTSRPFFTESVQIPEPISSIIRCKSSRSRSDIFPQEVESLIHQSKIQEAIQVLGLRAESPSSLVESLSKEFQTEITGIQECVSYEKNQAIQDEEAILSQEKKRLALETRLFSMQNRIPEMLGENCSICFDSSSPSCVTCCCHSKFCAECILGWMMRMPNCPHCRKGLNSSSLIEISSNIRPYNGLQIPQKPSKKEAFLKFIVENPEAKIIVIAPRFEFDIGHSLQGLGIRCAYFRTNSRALSDFENGFLQVLVLENVIQRILGLDLNQATHIVTFTRFDYQIEKRITAFGNRLGRFQPFHKVQFLEEKE